MKKKVILIDHQEIALKGLKQIIQEMEGFEILLETSDPYNVNEIIKKEIIDLILLDITNPHHNISYYVKNYLLISPNIKILGMGNHLTEKSMEAFLKAGGHGLILKDVDGFKLQNSMGSVLKKSYYFSPDISFNWVQKVKKAFDSDVAFKDFKKREIEIMKLICQEKTSKEIGNELCISERTVETHISNIKKKLNCKNKIGIVKFSIQHGLLE